ncbi:hypothetical protein V2J09_021330 [Rumex salicifolius]
MELIYLFGNIHERKANSWLRWMLCKFGWGKVCNFCTISLCNVLYKVSMKILANRMQPNLNDLIGPTQGSFIPGKVITEKIII